MNPRSFCARYARIDVLDDIDLSTRRPVRAHGPKCRPSRAARRHVLDRKAEELALDEGQLGGDPDAVAVRARGGPGLGVDLEDDVAFGDVGERVLFAPRGGLVDLKKKRVRSAGCDAAGRT
jgi:hypothetical protein